MASRDAGPRPRPTALDDLGDARRHDLGRVLDPLPGGSTRVITRVRAKYRWLSPLISFSMLIEFGDIWMMRKPGSTEQDRLTTDEAGMAMVSRRRPRMMAAPSERRWSDARNWLPQLRGPAAGNFFTR